MLLWLKPTGREAKVSYAAEAIEALLTAMNEGKTAQATQEDTFKSLIDIYGDPRTALRSAWANVPEKAKAGILRWLTGANIRFFMDVISGTNDSHMYEPRRRFWLELYERGYIDAAWVAFSKDAARYARQLERRSEGGERSLSFGHQTAKGTRANTSLLVFQIGDCVVVEGSHSYKVHIFNKTNPKTPDLFRSSYDCDGIRVLPHLDAITHNPSDIVPFPFRRGWQRKVFEVLEAHR